MTNFLDYIKSLPFWQFIILFVVLAIYISEILIIIQSYLLYGDIHSDLLIVGFFTPAIDGFIISFIIGLVLIQLKEKENKLLDSQLLLSQVQDYAQIGHWELLADQKTAHWSKQMYKLFGLSLESKPGPEALSAVVDEGDFPTFIKSVKNCFATGAEHHVEYRVTRPIDGEERWIECRGKVVTDSDGKPQKISGFVQDITERKKTELILLQSEKRYGKIFDGSLTEILIFETQTYRFIKVNHGARENLGYSNEELKKLKATDITPDISLETLNVIVAPLYSGEKSRLQYETIHQRKDGTRYNVEVHLQLTELNDRPAFVAIILNISLRKKSEEKLKLSATVFTHARESIVITDAAGSILDVNDTFSETTGYSREEAIGKNPRILQSGRQSNEFYTSMWQALKYDKFWSGEIWNRRKNGEVYAEIKTISAVCDENGNTSHYVALGNDITPIKKHQEQLEHIAHYDLLTNLPNRVLLADRLSQVMLKSSRNVHSLAVVFLDLDGFKAVNDTHGHDVGDELLVLLSLRMKEALREGDTLSRIGGDEFVAVLTNLVAVEDCEPVLERLLLAASDPVTMGSIVLNVSASIGVTLYPQDNVNADQLIRHADQAMYKAKQLGKNRYHLFDTAQDEAVKVQRESLEAIRTALDNHQFVLYYQPKVNMRTGTVIGFEALIRWQHPKRGLLNPIEFLPVIESHPMMIELGEWVIDSALKQISQWQIKEQNFPLNTSVNIAAIQLQQPNFTRKLATSLAAHPSVDPRYLELEVLETSALEDVHSVSTIMDGCMALGVNFALDDFGTGYSSLTYLRRLPACLIKIDQSFVRDMLIDTDDLAIVEGVITLAKLFKREVIAEGVETIEHGAALLQLQCELAQGYGIAKPMPARDISMWVKDWKPDASWQTGTLMDLV